MTRRQPKLTPADKATRAAGIREALAKKRRRPQRTSVEAALRFTAALLRKD